MMTRMPRVTGLHLTKYERFAARASGLASGLPLAVRPGQCAAFRLVAMTSRPALGALAVSAVGTA